MNIYLLAIAVLPVLVLAIVVYSGDKYGKEPFGMLLKAFLFGALTIPPAAFMEQILSMFTPSMPVLSAVYTGFVVAGCSEELWKLLFLLLAIWGSRHFDEYYDGVVYACFVSLGFACFENVSYVFGQGTFVDALATGSGYYVALAKFDHGHRFGYLLLAFLVPMLLHGTFDALLMIPESMASGKAGVSGLLFVVLLWFDIRMWKWGVRRMRRLQELSKQQDADRQYPFRGFTWDF